MYIIYPDREVIKKRLIVSFFVEDPSFLQGMNSKGNELFYMYSYLVIENEGVDLGWLHDGFHNFHVR